MQACTVEPWSGQEKSQPVGAEQSVRGAEKLPLQQVHRETSPAESLSQDWAGVHITHCLPSSPFFKTRDIRGAKLTRKIAVRGRAGWPLALA